MASVADLVLQTAQQQGVDPRLALEVAVQESNLNPAAVSRAGAIGVMQLMPATAAALGVNPYDITQNIQGGIRYLKQQLIRFGDTAQALAAYNWGPERVAGAITQWGADWLSHAASETRNYVNSILGRIASLYPAAALAPGSEAAVAQPSVSWQGWLLLAAAGLVGYLLLDSLTE